MALALDEARAASEQGEVPVGAVALVGGIVVAARHNEREGAADPTAHAEILALRDAASGAGGWRLSDLTLVVTLEPCPMCAGALVAARVRRVVFGATDPRAGACGTLYNLCTDPRLNHEARGHGWCRSRRMRCPSVVVLCREADGSGRRRGTIRLGRRRLIAVRRHPPDLVLRAGGAPWSPSSRFRTRSERLGSRPEECESGRIGRSRKPLCLMGTVGSNPTSSARGRRGPPHRRVRQEHRQGRRLAGRTWPLPSGRKGVNRGTRTFDIWKIAARPGQEGSRQGQDG